jgi:outer membrane protein TolC
MAANYQHQFVVPQLSFGPYLDVNALPDLGFLTRDDFFNAYKDSPPVSLGVKNNTTFDFTISQLIFSGEYIVGLQALKIYRIVAEKALIKTEDQLKETVAGTYYLVLVLGESIRVLNESYKSADQTYNEMLKMNQQGFNEETDVDQININRSNIKRLITSVESQREISMKLLKFQLGMEFTQPIVLTDSVSGLINQGNLQYLTTPEFNIKNNVNYQIVSNQEDISAVLLRREKSKLFPTVSGFYRRHEQTNQPSFNFAVKDLVGVSLNFPIFTSGMRRSTISQARFNLDKSRLNKENAEQGLTMEFETALSNYQTAYSNFKTNSESIVLSNKVY